MGLGPFIIRPPGSRVRFLSSHFARTSFITRGEPKGGGGAVETDERAGETRAASLLSSLEGLCVNREVDHITFEVCVMHAAATAEPFLARVFPRLVERYPFFHNAPFAMYDTTLVGNYVSFVSLAKYDA